MIQQRIDKGASNGGAPTSPQEKFDWINHFGLRFYMDHTARKGFLHLWDGDKKQAHLVHLAQKRSACDLL